MKRFLALLWILLLCLGLLIFSFANKNQTPRPDPVQGATPDMATPDTAAPATPDVPVNAPAAESTPDTPQRNTEPVREEVLRLHFLNGQPVLQVLYDQLTVEFFEKTGIRVVPVSSQTGLEDVQPVLLSVSNETELTQWNCLDLSDTVVYANLANTGFTLNVNDQVLGVASEAEPFGLIYNTALLARVGHTGADIGSFGALKAVAQYITEHEKDLGFGAFAQPDGEGRFADLLSALPGDIRPLWDLYSSNMAKKDIYSGEAVFCLGTLSDARRIIDSTGLPLEILPLYTGSEGEENRGLHCFGKHYWCVRADATQEEIDAALAFLNFLVSPRLDGTVPVDDLGVLAPYRQAAYAQTAAHLRFRNDVAQGKTIPVCGAEAPASEGFAQALLTYAAYPTEENWTAVTKLP